MVTKNSSEDKEKPSNEDDRKLQIISIKKFIFRLKNKDSNLMATVLWPKVENFNKKLEEPFKKEELEGIMSETLEEFESEDKRRKMEFKMFLMTSSKIEKISLTGVLDDKFYHTIFVPFEQQFEPFLLLEDGISYPVHKSNPDPEEDSEETNDSKGKGKKGGKKKKKERKSLEEYSYIEYKDRCLIYDTNEPLWFSESLVESPNRDGFMMVVEQKSPSAEKLYQNLTEKLNEYYDFYNENEVHLVASHVIHTYFLGLLGESFYLLLEGEKSTGKSSLQTVMSRMQYNGCFSGKSTIPALVRKIHFLGCSANLDEFDKLNRDEKVAVMGILNSGMYRTGTYEITNMNAVKGGKSQIKVFKTFGAKTFSANLTTFVDSFVSRCVVINTVKNRRTVKNIHSANKVELGQFQELRNDLFAYCMINGKQIKNDIGLVKKQFAESSIFGRRADVFSIVCGILKHFKVDHEKVIHYLSERDLVNQDELVDNRYHLTLRCIVEKIGHVITSQKIQITNEEIKNYVIENLDIDEYSKYKPTSKSIGSILTKHRIITHSNQRKRITSGKSKGKYIYEINLVDILERIENSSFEDLKEEIKKIKLDVPK